MEHATPYAEHVERVLKIATGLALSGYSGAVAQMTEMARDFCTAKILHRVCRDFCGPRGRTRLMHAARTGNAARAAFLLQCGASPHATAHGGRTALHEAAPHSKYFTPCTPGHLALVRMMVQRGADVNAVDEEGYTPLLLAANPLSILTNMEMVRLLVEQGADLEKGITHPGEDDASPWTPLTSAILLSKWEAAAALVALGAKVDAPAGAKGHNSLSLACQRGDVAAVRRLLDLGAGISFKACGFVAIPLAQLVVMNQGQHGAAQGAHLAVFQELLARGISVAAGTGVWGGSLCRRWWIRWRGAVSTPSSRPRWTHTCRRTPRQRRSRRPRAVALALPLSSGARRPLGLASPPPFFFQCSLCSYPLLVLLLHLS